MTPQPKDLPNLTEEWTIVDTHAHLTWPDLLADQDAVITRARTAGVERVLTVGTDSASSLAAQTLSAQAGRGVVFAAVGIHPNDASGWTAHWPAIEALAGQPGVVAIGETGLDFYREHTAEAEQRAAFRAHLRLAAQHRLPVVVHTRDSQEAVYAELAAAPAGVTAIMHCFTGDASYAQRCLDLGCYISFAGNITYPRNSALAEVATLVPPDRLLVETDSPFLAPQPWRGRRNEPAYVRRTLERVAAARGTTPAELAAQVCQNAHRLFGW